MASLTRVAARRRRHMRLRKKVWGTAKRPRMSVCFTGKHVYVQFVDDVRGHTVTSMSTLAAEGKGIKTDLDGAKAIGKLAAQKAKETNIKNVVFDRGGFNYHGRIRAVADAAREEGLEF